MTEPTIVVVFREAEVTALLDVLDEYPPPFDGKGPAVLLDAATAILRLAGVDVTIDRVGLPAGGVIPAWASRLFFAATLPALPDPTGKIRKPAEGGGRSGPAPTRPAAEASRGGKKGPKAGGVQKGHPCRDCGQIGKHTPDCPRVASRVAPPARPAAEPAAEPMTDFGDANLLVMDPASGD